VTKGVVYSQTILDHFRHPRNAGELEAADLAGEASNPLCGDRIRIGLRLEGGAIAEARFKAEACAICTAAASLLTGRVRGLTPAAAAQLKDDILIAALEAEIPPERRRCATLPLEALRSSLASMPGDPEERTGDT